MAFSRRPLLSGAIPRRYSPQSSHFTISVFRICKTKGFVNRNFPSDFSAAAAAACAAAAYLTEGQICRTGEHADGLGGDALSGAGEMLLQTGEHPGKLKDAVCSPGGSTIAGLNILEQRAFRGAIIDCVKAAFAKNQELGK